MSRAYNGSTAKGEVIKNQHRRDGIEEFAIKVNSMCWVNMVFRKVERNIHV